VWGRHQCDITIADPALSRRHATLTPHRLGAHIHDAGSTNGHQLWAGDRPVRGSVLTDGTVARLGDTWISVRGVAPPDVTPSVARDLSGRGRLTGMVGAAASSLVLAAITGRWYLALLAMVFPAVVLAPAVVARLTPHTGNPVVGLPDPTGHGSERSQAAAGSESLGWSAGLTIAVTGAPETRIALARAVILDRGRRPPPHSQGLNEPWMRWLPEATPGDGPVVLMDTAPSWCDHELRATPSGTVIVPRGGSARVAPFLGVSQDRADAAARRIANAAASSTLPHEVRWADISDPTLSPPRPPRSFAIPLGVRSGTGGSVRSHHEPWLLDLDAHGPHFVVAGTTGAGKSALLETLVLAACLEHSPQDLQLALIDFKGGAGLASCMSLPHVAGTITDLDGRDARRALAALADEVVHRKAQLAQAQHASFKDWEAAGAAPPRLLVVVDEFQEVGLLHREFMPDLTRIAAQGRSLGMHVVLATQRPAGAVTPEIRANTATTIALRVASEAESRDLVGTADAALINPQLPGRAVVAHGAERLDVHVALPIATPRPPVRRIPTSQSERVTALGDVVREKWAAATSAPPLWHPAMPDAVNLEALVERDLTGGAAGLVLGIEDWPRARRRGVVTWQPAAGPLVVVGPPTQVRAQMLATAAASARASGLEPVWVPSDPREAARTVWLAQARTDLLLVVEDAALTLQSLATVDRAAPAELLLARASAGLPLVFGIAASTHHRIAGHASMKLVMTGLSSHDEALWAVPKELADIGDAASAVRVWSSAGWREARVALSEAPKNAPLVASLPRGDDSTARQRLAAVTGTHAVGVGGDDARVMSVEPGRDVMVVGTPGEVRDGVVAVVAATAGAVTTLDSPVLIPPNARAGLVIVLEPTARVVEDLCRSSGYGLVDPSPVQGRVLWVDSGHGTCVQLLVDADSRGLRLAS
jgi:S-DNA-T family DNA segregation ATPase FtsK/SpoIIIE